MHSQNGSRTRFQHEALLYRDTADFLRHTVPFIRGGLDAGEPVMVATAAPRIAALRAALGARAERVEFADMAQIGANPARIIPFWQGFIDRAQSDGRGLRGIGEPVWHERRGAELVESQWHESLLNVAIDPALPIWLLCPYDASTLEPGVVDEALRSHPLVTEGDHTRESGVFRGRGGSVGPFSTRLPDPPPGSRSYAFGPDDLATVRGMVAAHAAEAGLSADRNHELVAGAHEVATNSVRHGGGAGVLRLWRDDVSVICDFTDRGRIDDPMVGRERPPSGSAGGRGLWLANQTCDLVQIRTLPQGTEVRLHMNL